MLNRILAVTALGLAVGLAACDQGGQEQAQTPRNQEQQQGTQSTPPAAQPPATSSQEQAPSQSPPPSQSPSGNQ